LSGTCSVDDNKSFDDIFDNDGDEIENDAIVSKTKPIQL
jgi:hypothetical protein